MKLIVDIKNIKNLEKYQVHGLIFNHEFLSDTHDGFLSLNEIDELIKYKEENSKILIANVNRIFTESEIEELFINLNLLINKKIDFFIFSDLAVLSYFQRMNLEHKLIYNARTMVTSTNDSLIWVEEDIYGSFISNELSLNDIKEISDNSNSLLEVYGYHQIFYSKRNLVSLYFDHLNKENIYQNKRLDLIEEKRDERYPITESKKGTFIYSPFKYGIFEELSSLNNLKMIKISSEFIPNEELYKVLEIYNKALEIGFNSSLSRELRQIDDKINPGFLYKKSVLLKGDEE